MSWQYQCPDGWTKKVVDCGKWYPSPRVDGEIKWAGQAEMLAGEAHDQPTVGTEGVDSAIDPSA